MLVILTGGIASGKSFIGTSLQQLGAIRLDADEFARAVTLPGTSGLAAIRQRWGDEVMTAQGELDRAKLGATVFQDPLQLAELNTIVHPLVRELAAQRIAQIREADPSAVIVYEVPLYVETGSSLSADLVVTAEAPESVRLNRLMEHRGWEAERARSVMARQAGERERRAAADVVIDTSGSTEETVRQVKELWQSLQTRNQ